MKIFLTRSRCCAGGGVVVSSISIVKIARFVAKFYIPRLCAFLCAFICFSVRFATFNLLSRSALSARHRRGERTSPRRRRSNLLFLRRVFFSDARKRRNRTRTIFLL